MSAERSMNSAATGGSVSVAFLMPFLFFLSTTALLNCNYYSPSFSFAIALPLSNGKRSSGRNTNSNGNGATKGFATTETLNDLLLKYGSRRPEHTLNNQPCPCGVEEKSYANCCHPYHVKKKSPESPMRVLQSRYSAFVYRLIGYIIDTTHPSSRDYRNDKISWAKDLNKNGMFDSIEFISLNILKCEETGQTDSYIDFQVTLREKNEQQQQQSAEPPPLRIQERSKFIKNNASGSWLYASGVVTTSANGFDNFILNS